MTRRTILALIATGVALLLAVIVLWAAERDVRPAPAGEAGMASVWGRATLVKDTGEERLSLDGSFTLYVLRESEPGVLRRISGPGGRRTVAVKKGRWKARVAADARFFMRDLVLGGTPTQVEPSWHGYTLPETLRIDLVGRALYPRKLRAVDFETGSELEDVRVIDGARIAGQPGVRTLQPSLQIEFDDGTRAARTEVDFNYDEPEGIPAAPGELPGTWLRGTSSVLVPLEQDQVYRNLVVQVPGYALRATEFDHFSSADVEVPMVRAGTLRIHVAPCADVRRILRVDWPGAGPTGWILSLPIPAGQPTERSSVEHPWHWHGWRQNAEVRIERGPQQGIQLEVSPCVAMRWRARLFRADGEEWWSQLDESALLDELEFDVTAGETTDVELTGCD